MFTYNGRDAHRQLPAARIHLPPKGQIIDILPDRSKTEDDEVSFFFKIHHIRKKDIITMHTIH